MTIIYARYVGPFWSMSVVCDLSGLEQTVQNRSSNRKAVKYITMCNTFTLFNIGRNASIIAEVFRWQFVDISVSGLSIFSRVSGVQVPIIWWGGLSMSTLGHFPGCVCSVMKTRQITIHSVNTQHLSPLSCLWRGDGLSFNSSLSFNFWNCARQFITHYMLPVNYCLVFDGECNFWMIIKTCPLGVTSSMVPVWRGVTPHM